jgi:hypothetical protein
VCITLQKENARVHYNAATITVGTVPQPQICPPHC